jgi:hypothetical protein
VHSVVECATIQPEGVSGMGFLEIVIGAFVKEGVSYAAGSLKSIKASRGAVARRFYALYQSLTEVQNAYRIAIEHHNDATVEEYDNKLRNMGKHLKELQDILEIYEVDLKDSLDIYYFMGPSILPDPTAAVLNSLRWSNLDQRIYERARDQLREFIKTNFKMDDLF